MFTFKLSSIIYNLIFYLEKISKRIRKEMAKSDNEWYKIILQVKRKKNPKIMKALEWENSRQLCTKIYIS